MVATVVRGSTSEEARCDGRRPQRHHVASNKARLSGYTALFVALFERAGLTLDDQANILLHPHHGREGYAGAHGARYNRWVLGRLERAVEELEGEAYARALCLELASLARLAAIDRGGFPRPPRH